jgi:hypothetical protein
VFELAHREIRRRALALPDGDGAEAKEAAATLERLRLHLPTCPICTRWFDNACRAYRQGAPGVKEARKRVGRPAVALDGLAASPGIQQEVYRLDAVPGGRGLDGLHAQLIWRRDAESNTPWVCHLRFPTLAESPEHGNRVEALRRYDEALLRVELWLKGAKTRLLDFTTRVDLVGGSLVSVPRTIPVDEPRAIQRVDIRRRAPRGGRHRDKCVS